MAELCLNINMIILDIRSRSLCERQGSNRVSPSCAYFYPHRLQKMIMRNRRSPLCSVPRGMLPMDRANRVHKDSILPFRQAVIEFDAIDRDLAPIEREGRAVEPIPGYIYWPWYPPDSLITTYAQLDRLTMRFAPLTEISTMYEMFVCADEKLFYINTDAPTYDDAMDVLEGKRELDLCSGLALACVSTSVDCLIHIVNIDQIPVHSDKFEANPIFSRSKTGVPILIAPLDPSTDASITPPHELSKRVKREIESHLRKRLKLVNKMTKAWLKAILRAQDKEETIKPKWSHINFMTLKTYTEEPGSMQEWDDASWNAIA